MTQSPFGRDNPFFEGFETDPEGRRANYFGRLQAQPRKSPNQQKFFEGQFEEIQNRYLGQLGRMVHSGQAPTKTLDDFLQEYFAPGGGGDYDWMQQGQRRAGGVRYNPPVQFDYGTRPSSGF